MLLTLTSFTRYKNDFHLKIKLSKTLPYGLYLGLSVYLLIFSSIITVDGYGYQLMTLRLGFSPLSNSGNLGYHNANSEVVQERNSYFYQCSHGKHYWKYGVSEDKIMHPSLLEFLFDKQEYVGIAYLFNQLSSAGKESALEVLSAKEIEAKSYGANGKMRKACFRRCEDRSFGTWIKQSTNSDLYNSFHFTKPFLTQMSSIEHKE